MNIWLIAAKLKTIFTKLPLKVDVAKAKILAMAREPRSCVTLLCSA